MSAPRAVRIPRSPGEPNVPSGGPAVVPLERVGVAEGVRRPNRAATQRAVRLTALYLLVLVALYLGFFLYARSAPGGTRPGTSAEFVVFTGVAAALGIVGAVLTLSPVPRAVIRGPDGFAIVSRWGRRSDWAPLSEITVLRIRRYPAGPLSGEPVDSVEISGPDHRRRSYLIEAGLLPDLPPHSPRE